MAQRAPGATHESWSDSNGSNRSRGITSDGSSVAHVTVPFLSLLFSRHSASTAFLPKIAKLSDIRKEHMHKNVIPAIYLSDQMQVCRLSLYSSPCPLSCNPLRISRNEVNCCVIRGVPVLVQMLKTRLLISN